MIVSARYDSPEVRGLLNALAAHYVTVYGAHDLDDDDPNDYASPDGGCLVGYQDGVPVALENWRRYDADSCELRRLYVEPAVRGRGWARRMLTAAVEAAHAAGYARALCSTEAGEALAAVAGLEVRPVAPFGADADLTGVQFYAVSLTTGRHSACDGTVL
ncbi:GNAT family N-acetyltransferase [Blastococcus saxobsidens]|uniref:Acetyltransferase (GNAT) family protein n=1 Tax=Blastococcus saxobsidens TaxID=138336 RepID=A0A4Q7Y983_9ACTN|nr:GNAT family N-acetyltransferase [Blastococcus saxobsidens]RZU32701.1 acetyltransferase (GNAT) family protein [Blastococcus saxobsidens]